jgi:hypothetical protein
LHSPYKGNSLFCAQLTPAAAFHPRTHTHTQPQIAAQSAFLEHEWHPKWHHKSLSARAHRKFGKSLVMLSSAHWAYNKNLSVENAWRNACMRLSMPLGSICRPLSLWLALGTKHTLTATTRPSALLYLPAHYAVSRGYGRQWACVTRSSRNPPCDSAAHRGRT